MNKGKISASMMCSNLVDLKKTIEIFEKEKIEVYENRNRTCVTRSILIRESLLKGLSELKIKYGLSISMLVNIAVKNEIMEEQK